jgi:hypothetical protein
MSAAANRRPALDRELAHYRDMQAEVRRILGRFEREGFNAELIADARENYRNVLAKHYVVFPRH